MDERRALGTLGLAMRAGFVKSGGDVCEREIRAGRAKLAVMDAGVSQNTRNKFSALCAGKNVPLHVLPEDALGNAIGHPGRMVAVLKAGPLTTKLESLLS